MRGTYRILFHFNLNEKSIFGFYSSCFESNLNGEYQEDPEDNDYYHGIIWELWRGDYSLKTSKMMIRSKAFHDVANLDPQNNMNNEVY